LTSFGVHEKSWTSSVSYLTLMSSFDIIIIIIIYTHKKCFLHWNRWNHTIFFTHLYISWAKAFSCMFKPILNPCHAVVFETNYWSLMSFGVHENQWMVEQGYSPIKQPIWCMTLNRYCFELYFFFSFSCCCEVEVWRPEGDTENTGEVVVGQNHG